MSDIMPYEGTPRKWRTERAINRIEQRTIVRRAELQAQASITKAVIDLDETAASYRAELRIDNAYHLAGRAVAGATALNQHIAQSTKDNPGLEMNLRSIEEAVIAGSQRLIYQYMTRLWRLGVPKILRSAAYAVSA